MMTREYGKGYDEGYADGLKDAPQRTWVGLSDEEIYKAGEGAWYMDKLDEIIYAKNIEAKLKDKNT